MRAQPLRTPDSARRALSAAVLLAGVAACGATAGEATLYLANGLRHGLFEPGAGVRWKLGGQDVSPSEVLALQVDSASPRQASCGVRFSDGSFLPGKFPDFAGNRENLFESESFGSFQVPADRPAALYVGGPPGLCPEPEGAKGAGVLTPSGELIAGEVLYVAGRFAGLRVEERIRKFSLALVYAVLLRPSSPTPAGPWLVRTLNGDLLSGEVVEKGFRVQVLGQARVLPLEQVASARQLRCSVLSAAQVLENGQGRRGRNGEGEPLQLASRRVVPEGLWQRGPSTLSIPLPAASRALVFRAWREPGFYKGQVVVRFRAGQEILKELVLEPQAWVIEGSLPLSVATREVQVTMLAGRDEGYGDRIIWEEMAVAR